MVEVVEELSLLYAGNVGFTGPIELPAVDISGLKSAPKGVELVEAVEATAVALGNSGLVGTLDVGGIPGGIPGIILKKFITIFSKFPGRNLDFKVIIGINIEYLPVSVW